MRRVQRVRRRLLLAVALLAYSAPSWAGSPPSLNFDPFRKKPAIVEVARTASNPPNEQPFEAILHSTLGGGEHPLVNFGGQILALGEETHGYRLIEIGVFDATFMKDGKTFRLEVVSGERGEQ